ncbi:MAG: hypothetical protein V3U43_06750 [Pseudomonadales bacterium]
MAIEFPANPDLEWDLDEISDRSKAERFVMQFETTLCVYSGTVEQLYSNYHIFFPSGEGRKMVILPDPVAYHDTFHRVNAESVSETGLYVVPGELIGRTGLFLTNLLKDRRMGPRQVPFEHGMRRIMSRRPHTDPFLPVLAKGDLREFEERWPVLHLHRVDLGQLMDRSALERKGIHDVIIEKLEELFDMQRT